MAVVVIVDLPFFLIYPLSPSSRDQVVMVDTGAEKEAEGEEGHEVSRLRWKTPRPSNNQTISERYESNYALGGGSMKEKRRTGCSSWWQASNATIVSFPNVIRF